MEKHKTCSFFGHRVIRVTEELKQKLINVIKDLIENKKVSVFIFGSRSEFDNLCHLIVSQLMKDYPFIKRVVYTCRSETHIIENERLEKEEIFSRLSNQKIHLQGFEEEIKHRTRNNAGKASYVERNKAMIDDSDYCVFYYDEKYKPKLRKYSKSDLDCYQPKSGTRIAYMYAKQKKKNILNIF